jgi:hypothetical protein
MLELVESPVCNLFMRYTNVKNNNEFAVQSDIHINVVLYFVITSVLLVSMLIVFHVSQWLVGALLVCGNDLHRMLGDLRVVS